MFESLTKRLSGIFAGIRDKGMLREDDVRVVLREIRVALLEADVALSVAKDIVGRVQNKAIGTALIDSVSPGQQVIKIVHDTLLEILGEAESLYTKGSPPLVYLIAGLQGSGKTTFTAKLGVWLHEKHTKKVMVASLDVYRPAAQEQLTILATQNNLSVLSVVVGEKPEAIAARAIDEATRQGMDMVILDTAGRLQVDEAMMSELALIKKTTQPQETLLVVDAMSGQDAVNVGDVFHKKVGVSGIVLSRIDGDARGGAALSMRQVTGQPIKFLSRGERIHELELYDPKRLADRILDKGDVVSLVERAIESVDAEARQRMEANIRKGRFDMNMFADQLQQIGKMGGLQSIMALLPGMNGLKEKMTHVQLDDRDVRQQLAIIRAMTPAERTQPDLLNASRKRRIARGSGVDVAMINRLVKQFRHMSDLTKKMGQQGGKGMLRNMRGLFGK
ncbi:MAG: signal recognition particle protein [Alphaproteobacteria bacterium]|nr:MAG: signal recognition particle protein [Alphaproteobacteria bacterium]